MISNVTGDGVPKVRSFSEVGDWSAGWLSNRMKTNVAT